MTPLVHSAWSICVRRFWIRDAAKQPNELFRIQFPNRGWRNASGQ
jgi:hypothetical protein